nr:MAG TPA: hypothetical protein [Caudoviricetes sp.]
MYLWKFAFGRFGGAFVLLITTTTITSAMSIRTAQSTITMPIVPWLCAPDFTNIHGQM